MRPWDDRSPFPGSLYPCLGPWKPPQPPCPPPSCRPDEEESYSVKVLGCDHNGNLILSVSRPRHCWANGDWVSCKKWR